MSDLTLSEELKWRGLIKDRTFSDVKWLDTPRTFYLGSDPSSDSLTIGNLAIYMLARQLVLHGWKAVLLVGGATGLIGDPGGKDEERQLKSQEEVARNVAGVTAQVEKLFAGQQFETVNNYDWFKDMGYLEFLRDVGKHYSMTELVQRDFIATRMGEGGNGISYAEFSYNLIQGYDFYWLFKNKGVELQIGGSDQWGNMLSGAPLVRKKEGKEVHALSMPLVVNKATGKKFGKSEAGAVWLDPAKTSPTQFYQFWINCDDDGIEDYLKIYTTLPKEEIDGLMADQRDDPGARRAQIRLAVEVTRLVHGQEKLNMAHDVTAYLMGADIGHADEPVVEALRHEIPAVKAAAQGPIVEALVATGLASSNTEARRLLKENAVSVNGHKVQRDTFEAADFHNGRLMLRRGKAFKDSALVELG
ncbi:MAG TPA: tyrosine--tRNA ligase [Candidatus Saccharimonadales bacterium]|nr:tyrosine--tRNA ligase [Candidatus Saccharimonadales bacterium]